MTRSEPGFSLNAAQRLDWLRLIRSEGVGPRTFRGLLNRYGSAGAALAALPRLHRERGLSLHVCGVEEAEVELAAAARLAVAYIGIGEAAYPKALAATQDAPPLIGVRGDAAVLQRPMVAVIGSRNASALGQRFTDGLVRELGEAGFVVVSGLARGIDARAHGAALVTGTVAVLAGGHERVYPSENQPLLERLLETGAAISEMPIGWEPRGRDFPRRNRIVSGLAHGVVVIEAARGSGSLITARFAVEQGREVFAVPGFPLDPRAAGTNDLIRQGATLITSAEHVIEILAPIIAGEPDASRAPGSEDQKGFEDQKGEGREPLWEELDLFAQRSTIPSVETPEPGLEAAHPERPAGDPPLLDPADRVLAVLGASPAALDDIVRGCGLSAGAVRATLLELELAGRIARMGGDLVQLLR
ncbi:DNA processing protein [Rhizobiales bacterium GAS188]|nr:DNA processing protein [Rhizobiales bacterium GAS188]